MMNSEVSFAGLIAPLAEPDFFGDYWDRQPLILKGRTCDAYKSVLTREEVEVYLARQDIRYPALRIAKDGKAIPAPDYSDILTFGSYAAEGLVNVERVRALYAEGATIILQMTRSSIPGLARLANRLQSDLQFNVETTVYLTPRCSQGFTTHYDTHGVLVLQVEGKKRWRLYDFMRDLPVLTETFDKCELDPGPVRQEVVLEPGDLLYVPRGLGHDAIAEDDGPSLHVSVGLFPPLWLDLFADLLEEMKSEVQFRRSPVNHFLPANDASSQAATVELASLMGRIREHFDAGCLMMNHALKSSSELTQSNKNRLTDYLAGDSLSLETVVARRQDIECRRREADGRVILEFYGKQLSFPSSVSPAVAVVLEREQFSVKDVQATLSDTSKLTFVRRLIKEGLLRIDTTCRQSK